MDVIKESSKEEDVKVDNSSFLKAIWTVLLADFTMSLDNVLGVAGAARSSLPFVNIWLIAIYYIDGSCS